GEEAVHVGGAACGHLGEHLAEEAAGSGGGEHGGGAGGRGDALVPGEGIHHGGQELAAQDLLGGEVGAGCAHGPVEEVQGVVDHAGGAAGAGRDCAGRGVAGLPAGRADAREVAGDGAGHGGEQHGGGVAGVDGHLEGGGGDEHVGRAGRLGAVLERGFVG